MRGSTKNQLITILPVMLALGTSWAIRGTFGHEYGAAWAGSIGILTLLLISGRKDWLHNWPAIVAVGAFAWGITGMISYGRVIGFTKSPDFFNASYGLLSLFVIGSLFGFLGGGFTGLILEKEKGKKIHWAALLTQMVAGAWIFWGYLIYQLHWFMTPPRSELWAACLGAAVALGWYLKRNNFQNAWFVAFSTMIGAGFGFAFGNFIQLMGIVLEIQFNWWNVMEYSIGFFGGLGMAWSIFNRKWEQMQPISEGAHNWSFVFLFIVIPSVTIIKRFGSGNMIETAEELGIANASQFQTIQWLLIMFLGMLALFVLWAQFRKFKAGNRTPKQLLIVLFTTWIWYKLLQVIYSGILFGYYFSSYDLAFLNIIAVALLWYYRRDTSPFSESISNEQFSNKLLKIGGGVIITILLLAGLAIQTHDGLQGAHQRFDFKTEQLN